MALVECPECGGEVSDAAESCPHCGHPDPAGDEAEPEGQDTARGCAYLFGGSAVALLIALMLAGSCAEDPHRTEVSSTSVSYEWPLTVESGELECLRGSAVVFHGGGNTWAVNGAAQARDYPEIDPIWRDHPDPPGGVEGLKVSIGPLLDHGLTLCE